MEKFSEHPFHNVFNRMTQQWYTYVILSRLKSTAVLSYKIRGRLRGREESKSHSTCDKTKI